MNTPQCEMAKAINGTVHKCKATATVRVDGLLMCGSCLVSSNVFPAKKVKA